MSIQIPTLTTTELPIPERFRRLYDLAYNLWWSWDEAGADLWRAVDTQLWDRYRNPIEMLGAVDRTTWQRLAESESFADQYASTVRRFDAYMSPTDTWYERTHGTDDTSVAYLCAEFGIHSSLPMYSGGLGVLAGDHTKSASDLGVPFVGVGLLYRRGYFRQQIGAIGTQQNLNPVLDIARLAVRPVASPTGGHLKVSLDFPGRIVKAAVWALAVGRVSLLLLDTDITENDPSDRPITSMLYVRGREARFCQEYVLGIGAVRSLRALGIEPAVWHVNEGHAAMSLLERIRDHVTGGMKIDEAERAVRSSTFFTLHTPVPAGNERFDFSLAEKYLGHWPNSVGADIDHLRHLASSRKGDSTMFDLGALAIGLASSVNGVSERHGEIVDRDWSHLLATPGYSITNGVHPATWLSRPLKRLIRGSVGADWSTTLIEDAKTAEIIRDLPDQEVWDAHQNRKDVLTTFAQGRIRSQLARHGGSPDELRSVDRMMPSDRLTIGFARRFATYKRATLLFHNVPWLQAILTNPDRPVQLVFAGKAHPADQDGQALIKHIHELSHSPELQGHVYLLEDYDIRMARFLVQGVDVWLNNPRPPEEASGTSGMKAAMNGVLNLSVLDGWWIEGFNGKNGWAFGHETDIGDQGKQDAEDAIALYQLLQEQIVPLFYDRDDSGIPLGWVQLMKEAMASSVGDFSSLRMVAEYVSKAYVPLGL